jgi:excisionase family DNA binding protein
LKKKPTADRHPRLQDLADAAPISEVARLMGVSSRTGQRWIADGYLEPFYLPGSGRPRIPLDQVVALRKQKERPRSAYRPFASRPGARKPRSR